MPAPVEPEKKNGMGQVLLSLANSPDKLVQLGTLGLVAISGVTNTVQNHQLSDLQIEAREKAVRQINLLYNHIDEFEQRQMKMLQNQNEIMNSNTQQIKNQTEMLDILREGQEQFLQRQQRLFKQEP